MKRIALLAILTLATLSTSAHTPKCWCPIDASKATLVSEPENKMSHALSTLITDKGKVWVAYYCDKVNNVENPSYVTINLMLSRFDIRKWKSPKISHTRLVSPGETFDGYTQDMYAPYDPVLLKTESGIRCIFQGQEDGEADLMAFDIDPKSGTPGRKMSPCTLTFRDGEQTKTLPISTSGTQEYYKRLGIDDFTDFERPVLDKRFVEHDGWYYNILANWAMQRSIPIIVRTKNGIDYEVVFTCPEFTHGSTEGSIAIHDGRVYIVARTADYKKELHPKRGCYLGVYSLEGECLRKPYKITDDYSRPEMIVHDNKVYAMYNARPHYKVDDKTVYRSRVRISEVDARGDILFGWEYVAKNSMQYYSLCEYRGDVYLTFIEDRFRTAHRNKGNVAFVKTDL